MAATVETDIDSFIQEQKAKLVSERNALGQDAGDYRPAGSSSRKQWDRQAGQETHLAVEESRPRTQEGGLPLSNKASAQKQRDLAVQRRLEYNQYLKQGRDNRTVRIQDDDDDADEISNPSIIPFNRASESQEKKRRMEEERQREYQQMKAKLEEKNRQGRRNIGNQGFQHGHQSEPEPRELYSRNMPAPSTPPLQRRPDRGNLAQQTDEYKANLPGMNESDFAKMQREKQRNDEYNQFLREKNEGRRTRFTEREPDSECYATLPGLRDSQSAKRRKERQRNQEYNEYLASRGSTRDGKPPPAPRKGWATPTYEDLLEKKRQQEAIYRRTNDPGYSDQVEGRKYNEHSRDFDTKSVQFENEGLSRSLLDDPNWLSASRGSSRGYYQQHQEPRDLSDEIGRDYHREQLQPPRTREAPRAEPGNYYATLPIGADGPKPALSQPGPDSQEDAKRRQKEKYRDELQQQMREAKENRRREKNMDMKVNYSGLNRPEERRPLQAESLPSYPSRTRQSNAQPYQSPLLDGLDKLDRLNSGSDVALGRRRLDEFDRGLGGGGGGLTSPLDLSRAPTRGGGGGLLDTGFDGLLSAPRISSLAPPPGLQYEPASFVTGGGLGQTSVEDAYNFYATHNPLDEKAPGVNGGGLRGEGGGRPVQFGQNRPHLGGGGGGGTGGGGDRGGSYSNRDSGGGGRSKVRFDDEGPRPMARMDFPTDDDKKRQAQRKAQAYQEELNRQIEEKKRKKLLEKEEKERYDLKLEREAQNYDPYGRGGGGAPMRDAYGNLITDLRSMRRDNSNDTPRKPPPPSSYPSSYAPSAPSNFRDDLIGPPPAQETVDGEQTHARGGHGIFGMPKTDAEKIASEKYKDDLRRQIEERKMEEMRKKEAERLEEEKEQRRVEEQQKRMQAEYEEERRKILEKEEEARKKNEELVRQAEERKREAEQRRKEALAAQMEEERREKEAEMNARLAEARGKSPPVPAARTRAVEDDPQPSTSKEENAPASRAASADVLNQLAVMRKQLQNERQRVEDMLDSDKKEPDVFDPRLVQKAPVVKPEMDVFETARHGNAVAVRRTPGDRPNAQIIEDFNALKHQADSDSRKEFRKLFPDRPSSGDALEIQQAALLRQQEQNLKSLREQRENDSGYPKPSFPAPSSRGQARTPQQLTSNSAFVDVDTLNYFPDDFDDMPSNARNESARARRRNRQDASPRIPSRGYAADPFGSSTSLNVDRLSKKNEDRLRRLRELQGDDMSLYDPDDVLDRFMSKQAHNRPPSGQTLQDDTWMFTGAASKASGY